MTDSTTPANTTESPDRVRSATTEPAERACATTEHKRTSAAATTTEPAARVRTVASDHTPTTKTESAEHKHTTTPEPAERMHTTTTRSAKPAATTAPAERTRIAEPAKLAAGTEPAERVRTVSWADHLAFASAAAELSGLEFLRAMARGDIPSAPMMDLVGLRLVSVSPGETVFRLTPGEYHYNPMWTVHGGLYATMLDSAAACAVHTTLPLGSGFSTLDLSVRFLKAIRIDTGPITATGRVLHSGSQVVLAEARLEDTAGTLLATATANCFVSRAPGT
ncbi:PaaI family thioesterase [Amycolatopsis sp. NPDC001319]|uniref:PaaI family thioesterase n=1 Tax=unclassified Amycolatopsis TaxID=2618356 RepID=UPI003697DFA7